MRMHLKRCKNVSILLHTNNSFQFYQKFKMWTQSLTCVTETAYRMLGDRVNIYLCFPLIYTSVLCSNLSPVSPINLFCHSVVVARGCHRRDWHALYRMCRWRYRACITVREDNKIQNIINSGAFFLSFFIVFVFYCFLSGLLVMVCMCLFFYCHLWMFFHLTRNTHRFHSKEKNSTYLYIIVCLVCI